MTIPRDVSVVVRGWKGCSIIFAHCPVRALISMYIYSAVRVGIHNMNICVKSAELYYADPLSLCALLYNNIILYSIQKIYILRSRTRIHSTPSIAGIFMHVCRIYPLQQGVQYEYRCSFIHCIGWRIHRYEKKHVYSLQICTQRMKKK